MTVSELHREVARLVRRVPMVPVAVDLHDGRRVYIDKRGQARPWNDVIMVQQSRGPTVKVSAEVVARVVPLDELPAVAGRLGYTVFHDEVSRLLRADPFRPFAVELDDGQSVAIDRPVVGPAGRFCTYLPPEPPGGIVQFTTDQVVRVASPALAEAA